MAPFYRDCSWLIATETVIGSSLQSLLLAHFYRPCYSFISTELAIDSTLQTRLADSLCQYIQYGYLQSDSCVVWLHILRRYFDLKMCAIKHAKLFIGHAYSMITAVDDIRKTSCTGKFLAIQSLQLTMQGSFTVLKHNAKYDKTRLYMVCCKPFVNLCSFHPTWIFTLVHRSLLLTFFLFIVIIWVTISDILYARVLVDEKETLWKHSYKVTL